MLCQDDSRILDWKILRQILGAVRATERKLDTHAAKPCFRLSPEERETIKTELSRSAR